MVIRQSPYAVSHKSIIDKLAVLGKVNKLCNLAKLMEETCI